MQSCGTKGVSEPENAMLFILSFKLLGEVASKTTETWINF